MSEPSVFLKSIEIRGLKGGGPDKIPLGRRTLVVGPNGSGKSRVAEAVAFLLGRDVAGCSVDGPGLRAALAGGTLSVCAEVVAEDGTTHKIERVREVSKKNVFQKSTVYVDGVEDVEGAFGRLLGRVDASPGAAWIEFSDERLLSALARVGMLTAPDRTIPDLEATILGYEKGRLRQKLPAVSAPAERLDALAKLCSEEVNAARAEKREKEAAAETSRREVGSDRVEPGAAAKLDEQRKVKAAAREKAADDFGRSEEQARVAREEIQRIDRRILAIDSKLSTKPKAGLVETREKVDALAEKARTADAALDAAGKKLVEARGAYETADRALADAKATVERTEEKLATKQAVAALIATVPCTKVRDWIDPEEQAADPFAEARPLATICPLLKNARLASDEISEISDDLARRRELHGTRSKEWGERLKERQEAEKASREATSALEAARSELQAARDLLREVEAAQIGDEAALREERERLPGERSRQEAIVEEAEAASSAALRERDEAETEETALSERFGKAKVLEERAARFQRDQDATKVAEARVEAALRLEAAATKAKETVRAEGERRLRDLAGPLIPAPWKLAFREGRIGLLEDDVFFTGLGLSQAQKATLCLALDAALDEIGKRKLRLVLLEADPLDVERRTELYRSLGGAVDSGRISQAIVCTWLRTDVPAGWSVVSVVASPDAPPVDAPAPAESDPFAAPAEEQPSLFAAADLDPFAEPPAAATPPAATPAPTPEADDPFGAPSDPPDPFATSTPDDSLEAIWPSSSAASASPGEPIDLSFVETLDGPTLTEIVVLLGEKPRRDLAIRREVVREKLPLASADVRAAALRLAGRP